MCSLIITLKLVRSTNSQLPLDVTNQKVEEGAPESVC